MGLPAHRLLVGVGGVSVKIMEQHYLGSNHRDYLRTMMWTLSLNYILVRPPFYGFS